MKKKSKKKKNIWCDWVLKLYRLHAVSLIFDWSIAFLCLELTHTDLCFDIDKSFAVWVNSFQ